MTDKRFDVVYEEDDEYKNIRYWEIIDTKSQNSTSNELEIVKLLNELDERWIGELNLRETLQLELQRVEEENRELQEIINDILNSLLKTDFAKKEYCNALLRIIDEENDVEKTKQRIKEFIYD